MTTTAERAGLRLGLLAGTGTVLALVVGLAVLVRNDWSPLRTADRRVVHALELPQGWTRDLVVILTQLGAPLLLELAATGLAVLLLVRRRRRLAVYLVVAVFGAQLLSTASKQVVARVRPCAEQLIGCPSSPSFPSGHAVGAAAFWTAAAVLLLPLAGRAAWTLALVLPLLVALSRVLLGVHYPSDVVAGLFVGWSWAAATTTAFRTWHGERPSRDAPLEPGQDGRGTVT